jgi:hypothetical protein
MIPYSAALHNLRIIARRPPSGIWHLNLQSAISYQLFRIWR